jgi:hypothetical protein
MPGAIIEIKQVVFSRVFRSIGLCRKPDAGLAWPEESLTRCVPWLRSRSRRNTNEFEGRASLPKSHFFVAKTK